MRYYKPLEKLCEILPPPINLYEEKGFCTKQVSICKYSKIVNEKILCYKDTKTFTDHPIKKEFPHPKELQTAN